MIDVKLYIFGKLFIRVYIVIKYFIFLKRPSSRTGGDVNYSTYPGRSAPSLAQAGGLTVTAPDATSFVASGGATLSRVHWSQQGPTPAEYIKRQTLSARGLSDKEFTKHCRGFDGQIKVRLTHLYLTEFKFYVLLVDSIFHK